LTQEPSPANTLAFERQLQELVRQIGRVTVETAYNALEPEEAQAAPQEVQQTLTTYRRLNQPTPNRHVATLFGKITLWRRGYRPLERDSPEATIFPLEQRLGLVEGATPALAGQAAQALAATGATQQTVLTHLREQYGVNWGVKKLRALAEHVSAAMTPLRREHQARQVVAWLRQAQDARGGNRPVLAVGRDGITLRTRPHRFWEVASTGTLSVYDRKGRRLGTVYLAYTPEPGEAQQTMTDELTALLGEVFRHWDGPLPRLVYVTDAGENETQYFRRVLEPMRHPSTGERLSWQWIVDYYHASERLHTLGAALFGEGREALAWARRMGKLLLKPNGPFRVLHAAAAMKARCTMKKTAAGEFRKAYNYLKTRTRHMQYADFRKLRLPIGSGVTEAACKMVFTQRIKLSGMIWSKPGAQRILDLRVILVSGLWNEIYESSLHLQRLAMPTPVTLGHSQPRKPR
jgi:hypothetical protein